MGNALPVLEAAEIDGARVRFVWSDGFSAAFAAAWLLDNVSSARASKDQRLRSAASLRAAGALKTVRVSAGAAYLDFEGEALEWSGVQLRLHARASEKVDDVVLWPRGVEIAVRDAMPYADYLGDDAVLARALSDVSSYGIVRFADAGVADDEVERAVRRFGFIRETNYGRVFEVKVTADPANLADTARALEAHADNPYRDPVPTLQLLHGIRAAGLGGETFFLDGFALAAWFRDSNPAHFDCLTRHAVPFAYTTASGDRYEAVSPVIRLDDNGRISGLRLNHRSLGVVDLGAETAHWYDAYLAFAEAAAAPERHLSFALRPGDIVLFDNERILHGRAAFACAAERLLKGCYADRDALRATLARLR